MQGKPCTIEKYVAITTTLNHDADHLVKNGFRLLNEAVFKGWEKLEDNHSRQWHHLWEDCDIVIEGDVKAQQGIRFNIFQLYATYNGKDPRLNIGPKGIYR